MEKNNIYIHFYEGVINMQTTQNARTESLHILVNPEIKEKAEWVYHARGLTLEDVINNLLEEDSRVPIITQEQWDAAYDHPDNQEAIAEFEEWMKKPKKTGYRNMEDLRASLLEGDDDEF
jgi:antitoxin component of RelBE/YafQ-DinJ toxin-antitoxin module